MKLNQQNLRSLIKDIINEDDGSNRDSVNMETPADDSQNSEDQPKERIAAKDLSKKEKIEVIQKIVGTDVDGDWGSKTSSKWIEWMSSEKTMQGISKLAQEKGKTLKESKNLKRLELRNLLETTTFFPSLLNEDASQEGAPPDESDGTDDTSGEVSQELKDYVEKNKASASTIAKDLGYSGTLNGVYDMALDIESATGSNASDEGPNPEPDKDEDGIKVEIPNSLKSLDQIHQAFIDLEFGDVNPAMWKKTEKLPIYGFFAGAANSKKVGNVGTGMGTNEALMILAVILGNGRESINEKEIAKNKEGELRAFSGLAGSYSFGKRYIEQSPSYIFNQENNDTYMQNLFNFLMKPENSKYIKSKFDFEGPGSTGELKSEESKVVKENKQLIKILRKHKII
jgi:hypothetical protein